MKSEVQGLLEKSKESIEAAKLLESESYYSFSASRAYYAMFYAAEALLLTLGYSFSSHAAVIAAYGQEFAKTQKLDPKYLRYLLDAQDLRNVGDYDIGPGITKEQAELLLLWADDFIAATEKHLTAKP